jgi:hypothetical protein
MADWKQATDITDDTTVEINLDHVAFVRQEKDRTVLFFAVPSGDGVLQLAVKEPIKALRPRLR